VNVIAGTYTYSWLRSRRKREIPSVDEIWVRVPGKTTAQIFQTELVLSIHFVPCDVEEEVVPIKTGPSLEVSNVCHGKRCFQPELSNATTTRFLFEAKSPF
jgi:hypothetical protein